MSDFPSEPETFVFDPRIHGSIEQRMLLCLERIEGILERAFPDPRKELPSHETVTEKRRGRK